MQLYPKEVPFLVAFRPYAGNWRFTWHIVDNKARDKLRKLKTLEGVPQPPQPPHINCIAYSGWPCYAPLSIGCLRSNNRGIRRRERADALGRYCQSGTVLSLGLTPLRFIWRVGMVPVDGSRE